MEAGCVMTFLKPSLARDVYMNSVKVLNDNWNNASIIFPNEQSCMVARSTMQENTLQKYR